MALTSWKIYPFFDVLRVKLPDHEGSLALDVGFSSPIDRLTLIASQQNNVSYVGASSENVFVGLIDGTLHVLDQDFSSIRQWKAHQTGRITRIHHVPHKACLITLAEDLSNEPELVVWNLDQDDKKARSPKRLCSLSVQNRLKQFPVTAFAIASDLSQIAIGFGNGAVTLVRGDFVHERGVKQRTVFESQEPVTGLEFSEANIVALFIATTSRMLLLPLSSNKQSSNIRKLDDRGCAVDCVASDPQSSEIVVARDDAIYTYRTRGRPESYAFEGSKKLLRLSKDYILVISSPSNNAARLGLSRAFGGPQTQDILNASSFTILHADLKFIAHSESLPFKVNAIFSAWGDHFLLATDGRLLRYRERSFNQKLDILYQRENYVLAIQLAQRYKLDVAQQNVIFRRFGDFLYQKGDYETAMQQYLKAIDNTEPSQIIRKFLDNQKIQNLIEYLEELHEHHRATSDHTTLLLNCYAKRKDVEKLEQFIRRPGELNFDLDTAIVMCRQGGYHDQAAFLARRHNEHGIVVDILIEDLKRYAEALAYIVRLEPTDPYKSMMKYGNVLLENCGRETTQLFIDYFTGVYTAKRDAIIVQEAPAAQEQGLFGNMAQSAVQNLVSLIPLPYMSTSAAPHATDLTNGVKVITNQVVETTTKGDFVEYEVPNPRMAFSAFIDHPNEFILFLETCISSERLADEARSDLYTTLFELYLQQAGRSSAEEKTEWEHKARALIDSGTVQIDTSNVLLLSELEKFPTGTILVSERQGLYFDIFRSYTAAKDTKGALKALHKYGPEETRLYPAALAYLTSSSDILAEAGTDEVDAILKKIDQEGLLAPLQVIQTLSTSSVANMGMVKRYLAATVERERIEVSDNQKAIAAFRTDTAQKIEEISALATQPTSLSASRCAACARSIELPAVHFLCKHSYHRQCLELADVDELECRICAAQNATVREIRQAQKDSAKRQDVFKSALTQSSNRFGTVSEWFGRGVMDVAQR